MAARDLFSIGLLVVVLVLAPLAGPSPYFLITPGGTYDIGSRIAIPDDRRKPMGHLAFTAVYELEASWLDIARERAFRQPAEEVPAAVVRPPGTSQQQVDQTNKRLIDESKPVAAVVGLRAAGFDVAITGQGAEVQSVLDGLPAQGVLQPGDVVVAADGQPTRTVNDLIATIRRHRPGEHVRLAVRRGDAQQEVEVGTADSPTEPGRPLVGVTISTYAFDVQLPFPVEIQSDNVGGPSAGFMFALGILDAVTDGDLTRGYYVAGTGTLTADGVVGAVGGAAEKARAAEQDGAQVFLVPRDNADEARRFVHTMRVVPVERFEDGVRFLCGLDPRPGVAQPDPPPVCAR